MGQDPEAFKMCVPVLTRIQNEGSEVLPIIMINGEIVSEGGYPDRSTLNNWIGLNVTNDEPKSDAKHTPSETSLHNQKVDVLIAIGSAVASGSDSVLRQMFEKGIETGISRDDMARAMQTGLNVRQVPLSGIVETANELLGVSRNGCAPGSGCC